VLSFEKKNCNHLGFGGCGGIGQFILFPIWKLAYVLALGNRREREQF